jgi:hypothetical protein
MLRGNYKYFKRAKLRPGAYANFNVTGNYGFESYDTFAISEVRSQVVAQEPEHFFDNIRYIIDYLHSPYVYNYNDTRLGNNPTARTGKYNSADGLGERGYHVLNVTLPPQPTFSDVVMRTIIASITMDCAVAVGGRTYRRHYCVAKTVVGEYTKKKFKLLDDLENSAPLVNPDNSDIPEGYRYFPKIPRFPDDGSVITKVVRDKMSSALFSNEGDVRRITVVKLLFVDDRRNVIVNHTKRLKRSISGNRGYVLELPKFRTYRKVAGNRTNTGLYYVGAGGNNAREVLNDTSDSFYQLNPIHAGLLAFLIRVIGLPTNLEELTYPQLCEKYPVSVTLFFRRIKGYVADNDVLYIYMSTESRFADALLINIGAMRPTIPVGGNSDGFAGHIPWSAAIRGFAIRPNWFEDRYIDSALLMLCVFTQNGNQKPGLYGPKDPPDGVMIGSEPVASPGSNVSVGSSFIVRGQRVSLKRLVEDADK